MSIKRIFIVISAIFAVSAVFADNSSVTSKKYVDDLMSGYQGKLPGSGANKLMIYDDETGIGEKSIETTLGANATGVPTVGAIKTGLDGVQDTITGTAGYVMTGTGNAGEVGERAIYSASPNYPDALVTAETVNSGVINAVNSSLRRVNENGELDNNGTLWEIADTVLALSFLPAGYTQLQWIEADGTQYINTGITANSSIIVDMGVLFSYTTGGARVAIGTRNGTNTSDINVFQFGVTNGKFFNRYGTDSPTGNTANTDIWYNVHLENNNVVVKDGTNTYVNNYAFNSTMNTAGTLYLFATNDISTGGMTFSMLGKISNCTIYKDSQMVRNFIPAKNSSNVIGMYDTVSGQFFTNQVGNNLTAGPVIGN